MGYSPWDRKVSDVTEQLTNTSGSHSDQVDGEREGTEKKEKVKAITSLFSFLKFDSYSGPVSGDFPQQICWMGIILQFYQ